MAEVVMYQFTICEQPKVGFFKLMTFDTQFDEVSVCSEHWF